MKRLTKKNRKMSVEAYACLCGTPDTCALQCGASAQELNTNAGNNAQENIRNYYK